MLRIAIGIILAAAAVLCLLAILKEERPEPSEDALQSESRQVESLYLASELRTPLGSWPQRLRYKHPHFYELAHQNSPGITTTTLADGVAFSTWVAHGERFGTLSRIDLKRATQALDQQQIESVLGSRCRGGLVSLGDPHCPPWRDLPGAAELRREMDLEAEESLDGIDTRRYQMGRQGATQFTIWYGRKDLIIRQQVVLSGPGKETVRHRVTEVRVNAPQDADYEFSVPKPVDAPITDNTDLFIKQRKEAMKKMEAERR